MLLGNSTRSFSNIFIPRMSTCRHVWTVKHAFPIPSTFPGLEQRPPTDKHLFQMLTVEGCTETKKMPMAKIILTKNVEGIGKAGEVIEVRSHMVREYYMPSGCAVYASPYNINKYTKLLGAVEEKNDEAHIKLGISKPLYDLTIFLNSKAVPVYVALENDWILQNWHITIALRQHGIFVQDHQVIIDPAQTKGPNMRIQNRLFRFYVLANKKVVIPAYGRFQHVTTKTYKQMLTPTLPDPRSLVEEDLRGSDIIEEDLYIHQSTTEISNLADLKVEEIWKLMRTRMEAKKKEIESNPVLISKRQQAALDAEAKRLRDKEITELRCRSFDLPNPAEPWDAEKLALARQKARRNRYWDDDLHNWPQPLGKF